MATTKEDLNVPVKNTNKIDNSINNSNLNNSNNGSQQNLSPSVYWAQTEKQITVKVDLKDAKVMELDFGNL